MQILLFLFFFKTPLFAAQDCASITARFKLNDSPYNQTILNAVNSMPAFGGYDKHDTMIEKIRESISIDSQKSKIEIAAERAQPSFCSGATYLVFLKAISELQNKNLKLSREAAEQLMVQMKPEHTDGTGVWGRWNADGPGTARLFKEVGLGPNFTQIEKARPGDFVKIFWNDLIGNDPQNHQSEHGHSVVFEGLKQIAGVPSFCFWSSNEPYRDKNVKIPGGMGHKCVPQSKIKRTLFSRLQFPERLNCIPETVGKNSPHYHDPYLTDLGSSLSSIRKMCEMIDCQKN